MSTVSSGMLAIALYYDHRGALQSSVFLSLFLSLSTITEGARARSFFLRGSSGTTPEMTTVAGLTLACVILKIMLVVLLEFPKDLTQFTDEKLVPDATVGFWGRTLLIWANLFMLRGYRARITMDDLASLGPNTRAQHLGARMEQVWRATDKKSKHALTKTCFRVLFWPSCNAFVAQLVNSALEFGNVYVIWMTLNQLEAPDSRAFVAQGVIGANVLLYFVCAVAESTATEKINILSVAMRTCLTSIMTDKAARLPSVTAKESALLSLMTSDTNGIVDALADLYHIVLSIPALAVGFYLLWTVIGYAAFFVIIALLCKFKLPWASST